MSFVLQVFDPMTLKWENLGDYHRYSNPSRKELGTFNQSNQQ